MVKFNNKSSKGIDGYNYSSRYEATIGNLLFAQEKAGEIAITGRQVQIELTPRPGLITYKPDFECLDLVTNESFFVEAKGYENERWPMKLKLFRLFGDRPLHVYYYPSLKPEIVIPKKLKIVEGKL